MYAPGFGPAKASLVILGEAPGFNEAKQGKPFTGPSGKLLDAVLANYGLDRTACYVDNVVACRPPDNRTPTAAEIRCCWPRALAETRAREPDKILTLGNTATQAVLGVRKGITATRVGPPKESTQFPGVEVIPTFHPAACLRNADSFPYLVTDVGKVVSSVRIGWEPPAFRVFDTETEACAALRELRQRTDTYVVDVETGSDKDTSFDTPADVGLLCVGIGYARGRVAVIGERALQDSGVRHLLSGLLTESDGWTPRLTCQGGKYDMAVLSRFGKVRLARDTLLQSYVLDERQGTHSLGYLGIEKLGTPDWKHELDRYTGTGKDKDYSTVPRDILYRYNAYDVAVTDLLDEMQTAEMTPKQEELHQMLCSFSDAIWPAEMAGVHIDIDRLNYLTDTYLASLAPLEEALLPWVRNPRSPKQVMEALVELQVAAQDTGKETLKKLLEHPNSSDATREFARLMLAHRKEQKLYGTYVKGIRKRLRRGRVFPYFLLHGTTTGRLSCRNPNLQNVPRGSVIRSQFIPAEGNVFVQADYRTAELRVLATLAREPYLKDLFEAGRDIHDEFSAKLYGPGFTKEQRIRTKAYVFGLAYGREEYSIAMEYGIPVIEARRAMRLFFEAIPEVVKYQQGVKHQILSDQEDLETIFGRRRRFNLITEQNRKDVVKEGLAFRPQSIASDINMIAFRELHELGLPLRIPVHDSILAEVPIGQEEEAGAVMSEVMTRVAREHFTDYVPFPVDVKYGKNWGEV